MIYPYVTSTYLKSKFSLDWLSSKSLLISKSSLLNALDIILTFSSSELAEKDKGCYSSAFIIMFIGVIDGTSRE